MQCLVSFYDEQSAPNKTVAMLGSVVCPYCRTELDPKSPRGCCHCHGDKLLTSQLPFNSNLLECAIAESYAKELFGSWAQAKGQVIKITTEDKGLAITVRITDLMQDHLCRCGHEFYLHASGLCHYEELGAKRCQCQKYEQRCINLTKYAFSLLAPLSVGLLTATVEKVG